MFEKFNLLFGLILLIILKSSIQQNGNDRVNEGASTSRQDLKHCEQCELENCATRMIYLMLAEDPRNENLTTIVNNRFDELQVFSDEIFSYIIQAQYSTSEFLNQPRRRERLEYFTSYLFKALLQILFKAYSEHYRYRLWYEYDSVRRIILIHEDISSMHHNDQYECLCGNYQERNALSEPFILPTVSFLEEAYQSDVSIDEGVSMIETSAYHVIPLRLILKFFEKWLVGPTDGEMIEFMEFNGCILTLFLRLRQSMKKLVIAKLLQNNQGACSRLASDIQSTDARDISMEQILYSENCFGGNVFLGPRLRGPLNPIFYEEDLLYAFEVDSAPIIGQNRYGELLQLFHQLRFFTNPVFERPPIWKLLSGFKLFIKISELLINQRVTPMIDEQWELRVPTDEELRRHTNSKELRSLLESQKFWAIRKPSNRSPRSINNFQSKNDSIKPSLLENIRYQWSKFVVDLMTISMESRKRNESLVWSCYFDRLYDDYLFGDPEPVKSATFNCATCSSFDEFLYSKISQSSDWIRCNQGIKFPSKWCSAWRRIKQVITEKKYSRNYHGKNFIDNRIFMEDIKVFMQWLSIKIQLTECKSSEPTSLVLRPNPFSYRQQNSYNILDNTLCFFGTIVSSLLIWRNDCTQVFDV